MSNKGWKDSISHFFFFSYLIKIRYLEPPQPTSLIPVEDAKAVSRQKVRVINGILEVKVFFSRGNMSTIWSVIIRLLNKTGQLQVRVRYI